MNDVLKLNPDNCTLKTMTVDDGIVTYYEYKDITYVKNPVDKKYQMMNIYVPLEHYLTSASADGNRAPVFMPNKIAGYMPGEQVEPGKNRNGNRNAAFVAITKGYIVVAPALRGRSNINDTGEYIGKAPAVIVDYKAAVRYVRHNADVLMADSEKIISNGTSAGGAISSLLGATGNHPDYEPYLKEIGAADERDDILAASCYCPIINLDNADMAYEWEFCGLNDYHKMKMIIDPENNERVKIPIDGEMTKEQIELSKKLKAMFPAYVNGLGLKGDSGEKLELDANGDGSLKEYIKKYVIKSAQMELDKGVDLSDLKWIITAGNKAVDIDFDGYVRFRTRMKETPAFDSIAMDTPENDLFGNSKIKDRHFTEFSTENDKMGGQMAEAMQIKMMNPMEYVADSKCDTAKHFRVRHGSVDRDTSLAISAMFCALLKNCGVDTDYLLPWGVPHSGDYDLEELFDWIEGIVKVN